MGARLVAEMFGCRAAKSPLGGKNTVLWLVLNTREITWKMGILPPGACSRLCSESTLLVARAFAGAVQSGGLCSGASMPAGLPVLTLGDACGEGSGGQLFHTGVAGVRVLLQGG